MATWKVVDRDVQTLVCHATLEVDRKKPIVPSCDHVDRCWRPRLEPATLAKHNIGLGALVRFALLDRLRRKVVQEVVAGSKLGL
jgi:hypothetical protein